MTPELNRSDRLRSLNQRITVRLGTNSLGPFLLSLSLALSVGVTVTAAQKTWHEAQSTNITLWFIAMACFAAAFVPRNSVSPTLFSRLQGWSRTHRTELAVLALVLSTAFVLRYYRVATIPNVFGGDEGEMGSEALNVLSGKLKNPFITGWMSHPTLFFFLQSFSLQVFGENVFGLRLLSVIGGTLSVAVTFLLIRHLFGPPLAFLTSALLATYNFHIHFSRLALNNIFDALFAPLVIWLFTTGLDTRRPGYFAGAGLALGASAFFYPGARLIPIILTLYLLHLLVSQRKLVVSSWTWIVVTVTGTLVVSGPLLYFFATHPQDFMARLTQRGVFHSGWFAAQLEAGRAPAEVWFEQLRKSFLAFNLVPDPTAWFGTGQPLLDPLSGILFVLGMAYAVTRMRNRNHFLMLLWLFAGIFLGNTLLVNPPFTPSLVVVSTPAIFFVALGLSWVGTVAGRAMPISGRLEKVTATAFLVFFAFNSLSLYFWNTVPRRSYGGEVNWVANDLANYLKTRKDSFRVYFVAPPFIYLNIGTIKFICPNLNGEDILQPITVAPPLVEPDKTALFVFIPARENEFPTVKTAYPHGVRREFLKPDGGTLFFIWEVGNP